MLRVQYFLPLLAVILFAQVSFIEGHVRKRSLQDDMSRLKKHYQKISRDNKECTFNSEEDKTQYFNDSQSLLVGDLNKWTGRVIHDNNATYYIFTDQGSGKVLAADLQNGGRVYLGSPDKEGSMHNWKLTFCGAELEQICLEHRLTKKHLSYKAVDTCYTYTLSNEETPFYLRW